MLDSVVVYCFRSSGSVWMRLNSVAVDVDDENPLTHEFESVFQLAIAVFQADFYKFEAAPVTNY